jgi:biopolymer transport protein ExbB
MAEQKSTTVASASSSASKSGNLNSPFALIVIIACLIVSVLVYKFFLGNGANFEGGDPENHPLPGNFLAIVYKGGFIVPILMSLMMIVITFSIERFLTIMKAKGSGGVAAFVKSVKYHLEAGNLAEAKKACDKQKGSVANVVRAAVDKYEKMEKESQLTTDQKVIAIQKEVEEATSLELPILEKNLTVIATIASIATLMGLLGTVMGMIKAFAAMANAGAPDASALSTGISEALINTALGIGTSAIAIIMYNYFTSSIDDLSYGIDEAGFTITQSYASKH